jgi:hypothetical protein
MCHRPPATRCALLFLLLTAVGSPSYADLSPGVWYEFGFDPAHFLIASGCQPDDPAGVPCRPGIGTVNLDTPPWTFASPTAVDFTITDGFLAGDSFSVLDFGVVAGSTPLVPLNGHSCGLDPRICVVDPEMSHDSFLLPAGSHSITVSVNAAQILGEGFFKVEPVPEPSTALLLTSALFVIWCAARANRLRRF